MQEGLLSCQWPFQAGDTDKRCKVNAFTLLHLHIEQQYNNLYVTYILSICVISKHETSGLLRVE